jgi:hypothetical protein
MMRRIVDGEEGGVVSGGKRSQLLPSVKGRYARGRAGGSQGTFISESHGNEKKTLGKGEGTKSKIDCDHHASCWLEGGKQGLGKKNLSPSLSLLSVPHTRHVCIHIYIYMRMDKVV